MIGRHSAERIIPTNEEAVRIRNSSVARYYFGILFSATDSVRNREKLCIEMGGVASPGGCPSASGSPTDLRFLGVSKTGLRLIQINVRGLKANRSGLAELMRTFDADIVCAHETCLR